MAFYGYNPMNYNPYQQQMYQQYAQAQAAQAAQAAQQPQPNFTTQNFGFVSVRSEDEARSYPVAPNNSVTFKDENAPYVYTKTMGSSQLDRPIFERYRLVKEDAPVSAPKSEGKQNTEYALKSDFEALKADWEAFKSEAAHKDEKRKETESKNDDE